VSLQEHDPDDYDGWTRAYLKYLTETSRGLEPWTDAWPRNEKEEAGQ
jgi:hypothetical protein